MPPSEDDAPALDAASGEDAAPALDAASGEDAAPAPIRSRPLRYGCLMCGSSCEGHRIGPLSEARVASLERAHAALAEDHPRVEAHAPVMTGWLPDGEALHFLNFPDERCVFLGEHRRCLLHERFGPEAKPEPCQRFPILTVAIEGAVRVGVRPVCYELHRTYEDQAHTLASPAGQAPDTHRRLAVSPRAETTAGAAADDVDAAAAARAAERQILAWLEAGPATLLGLLAALLGRGAPDEAAPPGPGALAALVEALSGLPARLGRFPRALAGTQHGARLQALLAGLEALWRRDPASLVGRQGEARRRFALFCVEQAVFLREARHAPDPYRGAAVYTVGALAAGWLVDADAPLADYAARLIAWNRLASQSRLDALLWPDEAAWRALAVAW